MINSTRSSESASRSSWKDASSVTSFSSTPSCSTRTSLTRSKTSSREAAMSPLLGIGFGERADANTVLGGLPGESLAELGNDAVLDAAGGEPDRARDRLGRGVPVRDDGEPAQAEEVGASVGVRIEMLPQTPCRRPDERAAQLPGRGRADLRAQPVERRPDGALEQLQRYVSGEAVGDDDVGCVSEQPAALDVSPEIQPARSQQPVGLERELVSLFRLLADREQGDRRTADLEDLLGEDRAHDG